VRAIFNLSVTLVSLNDSKVMVLTGANVALFRFFIGVSMGALVACCNAFAADPLPLNFSELFQYPIGPHGLEVAPGAQTKQGQIVRLRGFMVKGEEDVPGQFYFAPLPIQLSEHADGLANDLPASTVLVKLDPSQSLWAVPYRVGPLVLEGRLLIGRHEDPQGTVSWFQLQLPAH